MAESIDSYQERKHTPFIQAADRLILQGTGNRAPAEKRHSHMEDLERCWSRQVNVTEAELKEKKQSKSRHKERGRDSISNHMIGKVHFERLRMH